MTREELSLIFEQAGIVTSELRTALIMSQAELSTLVCSGARRGKQHSYALLDERAPQAKSLPREEALAELVRRYFISHGPATLQDFGWWAGLTMADGRVIIELKPFAPLTDIQYDAIQKTAQHYGDFLGLTAEII